MPEIVGSHPGVDVVALHKGPQAHGASAAHCCAALVLSAVVFSTPLQHSATMQNQYQQQSTGFEVSHQLVTTQYTIHSFLIQAVNDNCLTHHCFRSSSRPDSAATLSLF